MPKASRKRTMDDLLMDTTPSNSTQEVAGLSPKTKLKVFKLEAHLCNGKPLHKNTELSDEDIEKIWTIALERDWIEIEGFKQKKVTFVKQKKEVTKINILYELGLDKPLRDIVDFPEITYFRQALFGPETFTLKVLGLNDLREAKIGEKVKVNIRGTDFEVKPVEILEWMERLGTLIGDYRYSLSALFSQSFFTKVSLFCGRAELGSIACQLTRR